MNIKAAPLLVMVVACVSAQSVAPNNAQAKSIAQNLKAQMERVRSRDGFPGATIAYILPDGTSGTTAVGFADLERKRLMVPSDRMLAGSVGKTFVSAALLQLVDEHKIDVDDKLLTWLGSNVWFGRLPNAHDLTVRMLLNHSSGIPDYVYMPTFTAELRRRPQRTWQPAEIVSFVLDQSPMFPAGKGWSYSDTNYILVGMVIEQVTHESLYTQIRKRFLLPLHLRHTSPSDHPRLSGLIPGYADLTVSWGQHRKVAAHGSYDFNPQCEWAAGGFISTSEDLARWTRALYQGSLFTAATFAQLIAGLDTPRGYKYGLGVYVRQTPLGPAYGHGGEIPGFYTVTSFWPDKNLSVAVQFNTDDPKLFKETVPSNIFLPRMIDDIAEIILNTADR